MVDSEQCATEEDILSVILEEVRSLKESLEERIDGLERSFKEMGLNVDFLVSTYQNHNERLTLQEKAIARRDSDTPTPFHWVRGREDDTGGDNDV